MNIKLKTCVRALELLQDEGYNPNLQAILTDLIHFVYFDRSPIVKLATF